MTSPPGAARQGHERPRRWLGAVALGLALLVGLVGLVALFVSLFASEPAAPVEQASAREPKVASSGAPGRRPRRPGVAPVTPPSAPLSGEVRDALGRVVAEATVECGGASVTTDPRGRYEVPADAYPCSATASHPEHGGSATARLEPGAPNVLTLTDAGVIAGRVVSAGGEPVASYTLTVESFVPAKADGRVGMRRVLEVGDREGRFEWRGMRPGRYRLMAMVPGRPWARSPSVLVEPGRATRDVRLVLEEGVTLRGRVLDADTDEPLAGVDVMVDGTGVEALAGPAGVTSDDEGRYELEGAPRGAFYVRLFHRDYRRRVVLVSGGAGEVDLRVARLDDAGPPGALEVVGPGLSLASTERGIVVQLVAPDGPAARAGVARGELVRSIDGVSADELGLAACTRALWGELGSTVTLVLVGERGERSVALTRDKTLL
jgi:hypothetical protein